MLCKIRVANTLAYKYIMIVFYHYLDTVKEITVYSNFRCKSATLKLKVNCSPRIGPFN